MRIFWLSTAMSRRDFLAQLGIGVLSSSLVCAFNPARAQTPPLLPLRVAFVHSSADTRYERSRLEAQYPHHPWGRSIAGAQLGVEDTAIESWKITLEDVLLEQEEDITRVGRQLLDAGIQYWLLDLPAPWQRTLLGHFAEKALLFNVCAAEDTLRQPPCPLSYLHTFPSQNMLDDALAQYLVANRWRDILLLSGPEESDQAIAASFQRAARRFGLKIVAHKRFARSRDPRTREASDPKLLTASAAHDVVYVADADGEFARSLVFATQHPRVVAGANGLFATAWHPQWDRYGAPQVQRRFRRLANRAMGAHDWAAWVAIKTIAALASFVQEPLEAQAKYLREGKIEIDGTKGRALTYRAWDGQLRQPLLIAHANGVVATAPVPGVLHPTQTLDTLGVDAPESPCAGGNR